MTTATRPAVAVHVTRLPGDRAEVTITSDGRPRPGWRFRPDDRDLLAEVIASYTALGAAVTETEEN